LPLSTKRYENKKEKPHAWKRRQERKAGDGMSVMTQIGIRDRATSALNRIRAATARANRTFDETSASVTRAERRMGSFGSVASRLFSALGLTIAIGQVKDLADNFTNTTARLDLMNDGLQTTKQLQKEIMASANRSRAAYDLTADSVAKMGVMAKDAFKNNKELIQFTELINKQFTIAGTSSAGREAAMLQLTQAMAAGVLRGEELNSIFEQAPTIIQTIADYLNVPIGKIRSMAAEGQITSTIVKNAMLASADEINERFNSMPMTFAQVSDLIKNNLLNTFMPVIQVIGQGAQFIHNNWDTLAPVFYGVGAAALVLAGALAVQTVATWATDAATKALFATMLTNPIFWVALAIGLVVGLMYKWAQSVGGVKVAWLMLQNSLYNVVEGMKLKLFGFYVDAANAWDSICMVFETAKVAVQNSVANMGQGVLDILQNMVNGAIGIINKFIGVLNKIEGVSIDPIEQVTFATINRATTAAQNAARNQGLADYKAQKNALQAERDAALRNMNREINRNRTAREAGIAAAQNASGGAAGFTAGSLMESINNIDSIGSVGSVGSIESDVNIAEEDLKFMRDIAEMKYIQNFVTLTPTVAVDAKVSEKVDIQEVADEIERRLEEEFIAEAEGVYA